ncbi:phage tail protein, partial [Escherichia coli O156:H5]
MSTLLTESFEKWMADCVADNIPARPDAILFILSDNESLPADEYPSDEQITFAATELTYSRLNQDAIICSVTIGHDVREFTYNRICLVHQPGRTLCGIITTPVRQKLEGETLIRNFVLAYKGMARAANITVPPQSWQLDITSWLKAAASTRAETLHDFYGHHVFINDCGYITVKDDVMTCTGGIAYIAGFRVKTEDETLIIAEDTDYLYIRAWVDGFTAMGYPVTRYRLILAESIPECDEHSHIVPLAHRTESGEWEDLRITTCSYQEAVEQTRQSANQATESAMTAGEHEQGALKALEEAREI